MDNQLMDRDEWKNLGLPDDEKEKAALSQIPTGGQPAASDNTKGV